jgi:putative ABC transport system permease protein
VTRAALAFALFTGPLKASKGRLALSLAAIALGVALGYAVQLVNQSAISEFTHAVQTLSGTADLEIRGPRAGFNEALYPRLARMPEVAVASPVIEVDARIACKRAPSARREDSTEDGPACPPPNETLRVLGVDVFRAGRIQPDLFDMDSADSLDTLRSDVVFLSPAAADWMGVKEGDTIAFQVALGEVSVRVAGLAGVRSTGSADAASASRGRTTPPAGAGTPPRGGGESTPPGGAGTPPRGEGESTPPGGTGTASRGGGERARFALMDIAGAQRAFERIGRINRIDLRLRPGVDVAAFRDRLRVELPGGVIAEQPEASVRRAATMSRAYRVNLNVLALVALFTGGLLVFSTQALSVVRRRAQLALLRVLGMKGRELMTMLVGEALALGVAGATLGLALGFVLAQAILDVVGADLGSGYFRGLTPRLRFDLLWAFGFFALGVAVALVGSLAPALEAARAQPAAALKAGDEQRVFERLRSVWPGLAFIAAGAALAAGPPIDGLPLLGYASIAALLIGTILLMPRLARAAFAAVRVRTVPGRLALAQLRGAPGQSMLSLATIVASVSLLVSMVIMVSSFRHSLDEWLEHVLPADLYARTTGAGDAAYLTPRDQENLAGVPGVRRVAFTRVLSVRLAPDKPAVTVLARPMEAANLPPLVGESIGPRAGTPPPIWVTEAMVDLYGLELGKVVELPLGDRSHRFTVSGVWRDYVRTQGAALIERDLYVELTGDRTANDAAIWLDEGTDVAAVTQAIRSSVPGGENLDLAPPGEIRRRSIELFDRTFAITYVLELVALIIGLTGLSTSFGALVLARRQEFGVLRHIGMTRRQIGMMLAAEGFAVSALGLAVGLAMGWIISLILIHVVNRQSFHWSMDLAVPWAALAVFCVVMLTAASVTALASARGAMTDDAARAVKEDW